MPKFDENFENKLMRIACKQTIAIYYQLEEEEEEEKEEKEKKKFEEGIKIKILKKLLLKKIIFLNKNVSV